jgi:hypothetical protein
MIITKGAVSIALTSEVLAKHKDSLEFVHYVKVVGVRMEVLKLLLSEASDAKEKLTAYIATLELQEKNCLPVNDPALMEILCEINTSQLLQSIFPHVVNEHKEALLSKVNIVEAIWVAMDAARRDLERADKNRISQEESAKKKVLDLAAKTDANASKQAAKRGAVAVAAGAKGVAKASIFDISLKDESFGVPLIFDDVSKLLPGVAGCPDGSCPYLVHACSELADMLKEPAVKAALDLFLPQCAASKPVKASGRGQRPCAPITKTSQFQQMMMLGAPFADVFVPESCQE